MAWIWKAAGALCAGLFFCLPAIATTVSRVVDGDTVKLKTVTVRAYGYDTPEVFHPLCAKERQLGLTAKSRLEELIGPPHKLTMHFRGKDKYGRRLASSFSDGKDVGPILIGEGLAAVYFGEGPKQNWCAP